MSAFGDLMKRRRKEKGWTLEDVARKIRSHKGYVSGFEQAKVNPPSAKLVKKLARIFDLDERALLAMAAAEKVAPEIREDFEAFALGFFSEAAKRAFLGRFASPAVVVGPEDVAKLGLCPSCAASLMVAHKN